MSSQLLDGLQYWLQPWARYLVLHYPRLRVTSGYRSYTEQLELYRNRAKNPYPVAPPGYSKHNYGLAWDMSGDLADLRSAGAVWKSWGGTWSETDPIHFEV